MVSAPLGTSAGLSLVAVTVGAGVSTSTTVKASVGTAAGSSMTVTLVTPMISGASSTAVTVSTNDVLPLSEPSLTVTVTVPLPFCCVAGRMVSVRDAPLPPSMKLAGGRSVALSETTVTSRSPRGVSTSAMVKGSAAVAVSSSVVRSVSAVMVGASFTFVTVSVNDATLLAAPSLAVTVMTTSPNASGSGESVTVNAPALPATMTPAASTMPRSPETAVRVRSPSGLSMSVTVMRMGPTGSSSVVDSLAMGAMTGGSLMGSTVMVNVPVAEYSPSETRTVMTARPLAFASGRMLMVRSVPLPVMTTPAEDTTAGSDEVTVNVSVARSSASATVKLPVTSVSSSVVRSVKVPSVGAVLRSSEPPTTASPQPAANTAAESSSASRAMGWRELVMHPAFMALLLDSITDLARRRSRGR